MAATTKKSIKIVFLIVAGFVILCILGGRLLYRDLKAMLMVKVSQEASSVMGQGVHIGDLSLDPFLSVNLYDLRIENPEGFPPGDFLRAKRLRLDPRLWELLKRRLSFKAIALYSAEVALVKDEKGRWNIPAMLPGPGSTQSTMEYQIDEIRIDDGSVELNRDPRFRSEKINLRLQNISSGPGAPIGVTGTMGYAGHAMALRGSIGLRDIPVTVDVTFSSENFSLAPFKKMLEAYRIDTEKTRLRFDVRATGNAERGFHFVSNVTLKNLQPWPFTGSPKDVLLAAEGTFGLHSNSLTIDAGSLSAGSILAASFTGRISNLNTKPAYLVDMVVDSFNLAQLNPSERLKVNGIISSDTIRIAGSPGSPADISGRLRLQKGKAEIAGAILNEMKADVAFSSAEVITVKGEASAMVTRFGQYDLNPSAKMNGSATVHPAEGTIEFRSTVNISPFEIKVKEATAASLGESHLAVEGSVKDRTFAGKTAFNLKTLRFNDHTLPNLKGSLGIRYLNGEVSLSHPAVEGESFTSSGEEITIKPSPQNAGYRVDAKNVELGLKDGGSSIKKSDLSLNLNTGGKSVAGDLHFSIGEGRFKTLSFQNALGVARLDEKNFSVDLQGVDLFGGRLKGTAAAASLDRLFPTKTSVAAENVDLGVLSKSLPESLRLPYALSGILEKGTFEGTVNAPTDLQGTTLLNVTKAALLNSAGKTILKELSSKTEIEFKGRDLTFGADMNSGNLRTRLSGTVNRFLDKDRSCKIRGTLPETQLAEFRTAFWDVFPDALLYAGLEGSVSSDVTIDYGPGRTQAAGNLRLNSCFLKGEFGEFSIGPINGRLPIVYGAEQKGGEPVTFPIFEKSRYDLLATYYAGQKLDGYETISLGSLEYGFPFLRDVTLRVRQRGSILNIDRFNANIYGGRIDGSAFVDLTKALEYRLGFIVKGLSMETLSSSIEPIRGFISGKVDGVASLKGSGTGISGLIGMADFWTYASGKEDTLISKEFLRKIAGPSVKSYLGNRHFDRGILGLYLQKGDLIFKELEISNRNFFGVTDLSVKVAPNSNRIALTDFLWTITEAAQRAKEKK